MVTTFPTTKKATTLLRLRDGRSLEYAEYGDPTGIPVFYFHGFLGSCHQVSLLDDVARGEHIRVIAPNRPGIGRSSPSDFQKMTDYASDVEELADSLSIDMFVVIGASGGACFALACAYALPDRVRLAGMFGAMGPLDVILNLEQLHWCRRLFLWGCHRHPRVAGWFLETAHTLSARHPDFFFGLLAWSFFKQDSLLPTHDSMKEILWRDYQSVFVQKNGARGLLLEANLYFSWGFDLQDFPNDQQVFFWHGQEDLIVPWSVVRRTAAPIQHAQTFLYPGGHLTFLLKSMDEIFFRMKWEWDRREITRRERRLTKLHRNQRREVPRVFLDSILHPS